MFSFSNSVEQRTLTNAELKEEKAALESYLESLRLDITFAEKQKASVTDCKAELASLEEKINSWRLAIQEANETHGKILDLIKASESFHQEVEKKIELSTQDLATLQAAHDRLQAENSDLLLNIEKNKAEKQRLDHKITESETVFETTRREKTRLIEDLEAKKVALESEISVISENLAKVSADKKAADEAVSVFTDALVTTKQALQAAKEELKRIIDEKEAASGQLSQLQKDIICKEEQHRELDGKVKNLEADYEQQITPKLSAIAELESKILNLTDKSEKTIIEYGTLQKNLSELQRSFDQKTEEVSKVNSLLQSARVELDAKKSEFDNIDNKVKEIIEEARARAAKIVEEANLSLKKREENLVEREGAVSLREKWQADKQNALIRAKEELEKAFNRKLPIIIGDPME